MMRYQVSLSRRAIKALEKIQDPYYSNLKRAIIDLAEEPRPSGCKKLKGRDGYRVRVGDYRIIYEIQDSVLKVDIIDLGHRQSIYE